MDVRSWLSHEIKAHSNGEVLENALLRDAEVSKAIQTICRPIAPFAINEILFFEVLSSTEWHLNKKNSLSKIDNNDFHNSF